jgi:sugar phosphate permease
MAMDSLEDLDVAATAAQIKRTKRRAWFNVALALVLNMVATGCTYYSFGLFVRPITADLRIGRAALNGALAVLRTSSAVLSPFAGYVLDRTDARWFVCGAAFLLGGALVGLGLTHSVPVAAAIVALPMSIGLMLATMTPGVIAARGHDRLRGRALAITALGASLGGILVVPVVAMLVSRLGWRSALIIMGIGIFVILLGIAALLRAPPAKVRQTPDQTTPAFERRWGARELIRHRDFVQLALAISILTGIDAAILATVIPYGLDRGFSLAQATALLTTKTISALLGKMVIAWIADRIDLRIPMAIVAGLGILLCEFLARDIPYPALIALSAVTGLAVGGQAPLCNAMLAERFGGASFGLANGMVIPFSAVIGSGLMLTIGRIHDVADSYTLGFHMLAGAAAVALVAICFVNPARSARVAMSPEASQRTI